ncbi:MULTISPECIES: NACHT domain-containing NTPase [unclassified Arthrobacter]|uniref:NACHT domain-containing protein n=1 Tax=unclassified Arthrobacter TaxID=235627 RepID=UPI0011B0E2A1|nr:MULTISPECIES: hypothetical protein [unclassified Arthrobacter]
MEGKEITAWLDGDHMLCLTLDSFDEAHTRIEALHLLIAEYLDSWDCSRLILRIVSRTAEWPISLEQRLRKHYPGVVPYELLPLRRLDAAGLANSYGVDSETFLSAIENAHAVPLASRPLTLRLLATTFKKEGSLAIKPTELYRSGLLALCEERNHGRRDSFGGSLYNGTSRYEAASRLAALSIFGGRPSFWLGPASEAEVEDLTVEECTAELFHPETTKTKFSAEVNHDALQSGIFTGGGSGRLTWAHATFADYLAAQWISSSKLNHSQITSLLRSPSGRIHTQVRQLAAWLVATSAEYAWLIEADPEAFLLNVRVSEDSLKERVVAALLVEARSGRIQYDYQRDLSGLDHPKLTHQIREAFLSDSHDLRRLAIEVARQCRLRASLPELEAIALNEDAELTLRVPAAWAIHDLCKEARTNMLLPILRAPLKGERDPSQTQELLAAALMTSWPHAVSTAEVFGILDLQYTKKSFGMYAVAITEIAHSLSSIDLQIACDWLLSKPHVIGDSAFAPVVEAILAMCLLQLDQSSALAAATLVVRHRAREFEPLFRESDIEHLELPRATRLSLVLSVLDDDDPTIPAAITDRLGINGPVLLSAEDFDWLMDKYVVSTGALRENLGRALQLVVNSADRAQVDRVLDLPGEHPVAQVFAAWREPVELDSPKADAEREILRLTRKLEKKRAERKQKIDAADAQVQSEISKLIPLARAGDTTAFWKLTRYLTVPPEDDHYRNEHQPDLTKHPRWQALDSGTQAEIVAAAAIYVRHGQCSSNDWVGKRLRYYPATAGYCSLILLLRKMPQLLSELDPYVWREWAPIILDWGPMADAEGDEDKRVIMGFALPNARAELTQTLLQLVNVAITEGSSIFLREEMRLLLSNELAAALINTLETTEVPTSPLTDLVDALLINHSDLVFPLLVQWLLPEQRAENPERAREAGLRLLFADAAVSWPIISELMQNVPDFFKEVLLAMSPTGRRKAPHLGDAEMVALYEWLVNNFPPESDSWNQGNGLVGPMETVATWRESVLDALVMRGSADSVSSVQRIATAHPELPALRYALVRAEQAYLDRSWGPLKPAQIDQLAAGNGSRLVRSEAELFAACLEALQTIQDRLQGDTPSSPLLWDTYSKRPKSEDDVSDYLRTELLSVLLARGAVVNREVQVRRVNTGVGERTDIRVDAVDVTESNTPNLFTIVAEVKGCWNPQIEDSLQSQLVDRYMADLNTNYGIYIAVWFGLESWTNQDHRRRKAAAFGSREALLSVLQEKSVLQMQAGRRVEVVVIDASLTRPRQASCLSLP